MAKLTVEQATRHRKAQDLVELDRELTVSEREFVLDNWMESATARLDGAFFTPPGLAHDLRLEVTGKRVIDLCAGIGRLAWACQDTEWERLNGEPPRELVCVERNPEYVRVGKKVLPEATWICADVFEVPDMDLGQFDTAIGNPPYGAVYRHGRNSPRYTGGRFEYHVIDIAAEVARNGVFIIPQEMAPFRYSGNTSFIEQRTAPYDRFERQTGIVLGFGIGIDTSYYANEWRDAAPNTEVVRADFEGVRVQGGKKAARTANTAEPAKGWRSAASSTNSAKTKSVMSAVGDDSATGTIGLFDI
ncbi:methyltransferase [Streptomyces rubradiris]|uniref:methyltransferase n=1 Tax=Streptomyces rubradiris TaxID=285531 RepID=UPI001676D4BD|nr:methyltransferase [Streptomyces rubradiris]GHH31597.1 hypothetical protein GCM10018792_79440 [Streptomyces rubradiris]